MTGSEPWTNYKSFPRVRDTVNFENRYRCKDGSYRWFRWACPAAAPGEPLLYAMAHDVSEQKQVKNQLAEAKDRVLEATRLKSEFLANMSHEIRTPMNVVIGMTELALDTELDRQQRQYLDMVKSSAQSLLTIINDLLDFSKIEAGKLDFDAVTFNVAQILRDVTQAVTPRARQKGLTLSCDVQPEIPEAVVGDPLRLRQVVLNLVSNAVKFTERGTVAVRAELDSQTTDDVRVRFVVADTGIGIAEEEREHIFDTFVQVDGSETRRFCGTGLGLTICDRLVQGMGGQITVQSELGKGGAFSFTARFRKPTPTEERRVELDQLKGLRVIVVDQDPDARRRITQMLDSWTLDAVAVGSFPSALQVMKWSSELDQPFSLALFDAESLKKKEPSQSHGHEEPALGSLPIIVMGEKHPDSEQFRWLEAAAYLSKPVSQPRLLEAVLRIIAPSFTVAREAARKSQQDFQSGPPRRLSILLVEDVSENQALAQILLEKQGHAVVPVLNGKEALEAFHKQSFDVILMDVQMPLMGGIEATVAIREKERATGIHTPIIALTGHAMKGDREKYLRAGMDGYVSKPIRRQELFDTIGQLVSKTLPT